MVGMMMGYSWLVQISLELARTDRLSRNCVSQTADLLLEAE